MSLPVTAILPTFNRAPLLRLSLDSVLAQTIPPVQVIVVDDGSRDRTPQLLARYSGRVEVLRQDNAGKSVALNRALERVRGEAVWFFDDDDIALPDALARHLAVWRERPGIGFTYSSCLRAEIDRAGNVMRAAEPPLPEFPEAELFVRLLERNFLTHPGLLARAACYRQVGPFDPTLIRSQDYDMLLRLARAFPAARVPAPTFYMRVHAGGRGSAGQPESGTSRTEGWFRYNRPIFARLRAELPLSAYLPLAAQGGELVPADRRQALLQRLSVMGFKGMWSELLEDLDAFLAETARPGSPPVLTPPERAIVARALDRKSAVADLRRHPEVTAAIRARTGAGPGRELRRGLARALRRRVSGALHRLEPAYAADLTIVAARLGGVGR